MADASTDLPANPRVLLTNDDGIRAEGIAALWRAASPWTSVRVVAPETVQSATGHGVTLHAPLLTQELKLGAMTGTAVDGRPADCVKLALNTMAQDAQLVLSGMNLGANVGVDVFYSGTVAAAVEAAFFGLPAVAISLHLSDAVDDQYDQAAASAMDVVRTLWSAGQIMPGGVVNINVPALGPGEKPAGVKVVPQCLYPWSDTFEQRSDPTGRAYYWNTSRFSLERSQGDTDVVALKEKFITVTPLHFDLTSRDRLGGLASALGD
ncbi:MAG: 5'/3'-nucleotidase SurE [Planctomycetota bacterium]